MQRHIITTTSSSASGSTQCMLMALPGAQAPQELLFSHPTTFPNLSRYSRPSAELNRGDGAPRAGGVSQQLLHRDANGDHTDGIRVGLIKNCPKSLDSFGCCERAVLGIHSLQRTAKG